jgi:L,D-transpeptidase catalytic domain
VSSHRRELRPRYGRMAVLAVAAAVSGVAGLAGMGVLATGSVSAGASAARAASYTQPSHPSSSTGSGATSTQGEVSGGLDGDSADGSVPAPHGMSTSPGAGRESALPLRSGHGRRIVFSQSRQRVWLVTHSHGSDDVDRTYLVSGSVHDNLQPGTYAVYSRSRWAVGVEDSGVMEYFVRFTQGPTGAAIGFHSIPTDHDVPLQTRAQLGTPQSHGCIRQDLPDAVALWHFAPVGTKVVVVA